MSSKITRDQPVSGKASPDVNDLGFSTRSIHEPFPSTAIASLRSGPSASVCGRTTLVHPGGADGDRSATWLLEHKLARLEGAEAGLVLSSGLVAFRTLARSFLAAGDEMIVHRPVCTDTAYLMREIVSAVGAKLVAVDLSEPSAIGRSITERTRLVYFNTPTNPLNSVLDVSAISEDAHAFGLKVAVDSTFATPVLQRPLEHGADIVLHSLSKYMNGHGDTVGGALLGTAADIRKLRNESLRERHDTAISPQAAFLILRGLSTLALRMNQHCNTAHALALTLEAHPSVAWVRYPFLTSHPDHEITRRQMSGGSGMLAFGLETGPEGATAMIKRLSLIRSGGDLAEVGSFICGSARLTNARHLSLVGSQFCVNLGEDVIRCSVGLEDAEDLVEDLLTALEFA
ncbi:trans-sulfuration enzyme family protein [Sinorhizobium meliloti]|uniref:Methionine gamma-lyase n=1 Tax=Rhizobium meliloti TaxID=382 RepID=A0A2J0YVD8_RHIML|nr:aminotransferase class I/II-fold pyridoxal phosphate-dependent enzyme [Sinorhizobium meliloti]PJR10747.1 methionine gamma-lyase [Sinorhizobium meliloti]